MLSEHPYLYCNADPVNCVDPSGNSPQLALAGGGALAVGAALGGTAAGTFILPAILIGAGIAGLVYGGRKLIDAISQMRNTSQNRQVRDELRRQGLPTDDPWINERVKQDLEDNKLPGQEVNSPGELKEIIEEIRRQWRERQE